MKSISRGRTTRSCGEGEGEGEAQKVALGKDGTKWRFEPLGARAVREMMRHTFRWRTEKISDVLGSHNGAYEHSCLLGCYAVPTSVADFSEQRRVSISLQNYSKYLLFLI